MDIDQDVNDLFERLLTGEELNHVFEDYDFNASLHTALEDIHKDVTRYIKSHRLDLYQNHYPYFFRPVVNHMLLSLSRPNFRQFEPFEIRSNFRFEVLEPDIYATMQSASPFTYHPFQIQTIDLLSQELRINIHSNEILFNHNELILWISPRTSLNNHLKAKKILNNSKNISLAYSSGDEIKYLQLTPKETVMYDQPFLMQAMLEGISPEMFGYQAFEINELEKIENQQIKLSYISILLDQKSAIPDNLNDLFTFNLMPVLSILDDYAAPINVDGTVEYYPIIASESTSYKSFYMENEILLDNRKLHKYASSQSEMLNYVIRRESNRGCAIKVQAKIADILNRQLQIFATWTQLLPINQYQDKSIKTMDRDKLAYIPNVIFKRNHVLNNNDEKIDRFIELSNLINYRFFTKETIQSIGDISSLNAESIDFLKDLVSVDFQQENKQLILSFKDVSNIQKLKIDQGVNRLNKVINYLVNDNINVTIDWDKFHSVLSQ